MKNYNFPYPKKVRDRIRHIQKQYEKLEQPKIIVADMYKKNIINGYLILVTN